MGDIKVDRLLEMDGLFGVLEFVQNSDWSTILPVSTVIDDISSHKYSVNPIIKPKMIIEYYLIHQTQRPLNRASRELADNLTEALKKSAKNWEQLQK